MSLITEHRSQPTDTRSIVGKVYDDAYKQGFDHAIEFCEMTINKGGSLYAAIELMKEFINKKFTKNDYPPKPPIVETGELTQIA